MHTINTRLQVRRWRRTGWSFHCENCGHTEFREEWQEIGQPLRPWEDDPTICPECEADDVTPRKVSEVIREYAPKAS